MHDPRQLDRIERQLRVIAVLVVGALNQGDRLMFDIARMTAAVAANTDATASVVLVVKNLAEQVRALGSPEAQALATQIESNSQALADAALLNTPAA